MKFATAAGTVVLAGGLVVAAGAIEANAYAVRQVNVKVLPPGSRPVRLLHLSDLHLTPGQRRKISWVRSLAAFRPDLVVTTGDNLAHADAVPAVGEALEVFAEVPGAFVFGSNDYYGPRAKNPFGYFGGPSKVKADLQDLDSEGLRSMFAHWGWHDLNNLRSSLEVVGLRIALVGTDDAHLGRDHFPAAQAVSADLKLGITHAPYARVLDQMVTDGTDVIFAGHTHGGQVCLPGVGALVTNCDLPRHQASGLSHWSVGEDSVPLQVSAGVGTSPFAPVRLFCRPEATVLTMLPKD